MSAMFNPLKRRKLLQAFCQCVSVLSMYRCTTRFSQCVIEGTMCEVMESVKEKKIGSGGF